MAILEFSSSNGFSSFSLNFECRNIQITEIGDQNNNYFTYLVNSPWDLRSDTSCDERGYEEWDTDRWIDCTTTFQGKKCSVI